MRYNIESLLLKKLQSMMKKILSGIILSLLICSGAQARTSISFSVNPITVVPGRMMMDDYAYEDMVWMEHIRAQRLRDRMMRMQMAQMGYPRYIHVIDRYDTYVEPYFGRRHTVYTRQYVQHRQAVRCYRHRC